MVHTLVLTPRAILAEAKLTRPPHYGAQEPPFLASVSSTFNYNSVNNLTLEDVRLNIFLCCVREIAWPQSFKSYPMYS